MRFFRLMAITVVLLACVVLGTACAGAKGEQGADGVGIQNVAYNADGTMTVNLTNGEKYTSDNLTGPQGAKGDTGSQGSQGIQGAQGIQGVQGVAGPNMIAAMGFVSSPGDLAWGYNATSASYASPYYHVTLTGISAAAHYAVVLTPFFNTLPTFAYTLSTSGDLMVAMYDSGWVQCGFSFVVLRSP